MEGTPVSLALSESRHILSVPDHQQTTKADPSNYTSKDYTPVDEPDQTNMPEDSYSYGYGQRGRQGLPPHAFGKSMGYRTTSKAENEIPHRLKENQAAANKTIQPPYTPDKGTQQQASVPRLAQLDVDEVPSAAGRKETTSTNPGQDSKGLGLARAHMGKSSYTSRPSTQMPTPNAQNPQVGAGGAPGPARSTQPLRVQPARVVHPLPAQVGSPGPAVATGTWDSTDSWAKPLNIKMPKPDSFYDIDFSTRPPPNIVVKIAHTVKDKSGKEVVQKPINPASQIDFPGLSKLTQSVAANTTSPPYKQTPLQQAKHSIPQHSTVRPYHDEQLTTVTPQQESSETPVKNDEQPKLAESLHVNAEISPQPTSNLTRAQPTAQDKASTPQPKGILRYFRPVASSQKQQDAGSKQELPSAAPVSTSLRTERRTEGGLFTDGTAFVAQALSNQKKKATDTLEVSAAQEKNSTADTSSGVTMDDVIANIYAKTVAPQQSGKPNISNKSVRGRSDGKRSIAAASLNFEDTFQGRNLSVPSETPVVLYRGRQAKNPYQTNEELGVPADYEPGQLRGWDGDWAPPPVEWDLRDMYDYRKPQHRESIKNYAIDRYLAFKKGLCPALNIGNDAFTSGASLAVGLSHFASPINPEAHHHIAATDPYTLNKYHQSAENAVKNYLHVNKYRLEAKEAKRQAKRLTAAEKKEMGKQYEAMMQMSLNNPPNPWKPEANIYFRPARVKDLPQIRVIHNHYTRVSVVTQERVELSDREMHSRYDDCATGNYPFIVAISRHGKAPGKDELVVGFAYAEDFGGEQTMWRHTCEVQFYVHGNYLRKGIGKNMLDTLFRGITPFYHYHNAAPFRYTDAEQPRHDGGGVRMIKKVVIPFPYIAAEKEQQQWLLDWLAREWDFEVQCDMQGLGHVGVEDKAVNFMQLVMTIGV